MGIQLREPMPWQVVIAAISRRILGGRAIMGDSQRLAELVIEHVAHYHECGICHSLYVCPCTNKSEWGLCLKCRVMSVDDLFPYREHTHKAYVTGCHRCELNKEEDKDA